MSWQGRDSPHWVGRHRQAILVTAARGCADHQEPTSHRRRGRPRADEGVTGRYGRSTGERTKLVGNARHSTTQTGNPPAPSAPPGIDSPGAAGRGPATPTAPPPRKAPWVSRYYCRRDSSRTPTAPAPLAPTPPRPAGKLRARRWGSSAVPPAMLLPRLASPTTRTRSRVDSSRSRSAASVARSEAPASSSSRSSAVWIETGMLVTYLGEAGTAGGRRRGWMAGPSARAVARLADLLAGGVM